MSKSKPTGPDATTAIDTGLERPAPSADPYGKRDPIPESLRVILNMYAGPRAPREIAITKPLTILGRDSRVADIDVGDNSASRRHAYIKYSDGNFWVGDMGSTNGTILNGSLVSESKLSSGDEIQIGVAVMRLEIS